MSPDVVVRRSQFGWSVLAATLAVVTAAPGCGGRGAVSIGGPSAGGTDGAAGTVGGGAAGTCAPERLTAPQATSLYRMYAGEVTPDPNPTTVLEAQELEVEGLWQGLNAQLFHVSGGDKTGGFFFDCTILTHACRVFVPAGDCEFGTLQSGLVANGAFYFSWGWGSGDYRSQVGKLTPDGTAFTRVVSAPYRNASYGPPPLVIKKAGTDIVVYRANVTAFNRWSSTDPLGKLDDRGDSLIVVDGSGRPLANPLP